MSMVELLKDVTECVNAEYDRAAEKWGPVNHSDHESYAVLLEELQEAEQELDCLKSRVQEFWSRVRDDRNDSTLLFPLKGAATSSRLLVAEAIQVAAMVEKAKETIVSRMEKLEEGA